MAKPQFAGLDLIRFAAALGVALYHLAYWWWLPRPIIAEPVRWGWVGVPVFFVLSGFVIALSADGKTAGQFAAGRALRLYPAAWICATLTLIAARWGTDGAVADYARSLVLFPVGPWISGVYWTLAVEIVFYALVAVALAVGWRLTRVAAVLGIASGAYWTLRSADFATGGHFKAIFGAIDSPVGGLTLLTYGCYFSVGMALWADRKMLMAFGVLVSLIAVAASARFYLTSQGGAAIHIVEAPMIFLTAAAAIIASVKWQSAVWSRLGRFAPYARTIGLMTYPLYLIHSEVGHRIMLALPVRPAFALALALAVVVLLSFVVVWAEKYPRRALKSLLQMRRRNAPAPAADLP